MDYILDPWSSIIVANILALLSMINLYLVLFREIKKYSYDVVKISLVNCHLSKNVIIRVDLY